MTGRAPRLLVGLLAACLAGSSAPAGDMVDKRSGADFMSPENRAMQADDMSNPGMFAVLDGEQLWNRPEGANGRSCAGCHGEAATSMRGVAARYPAFDERSERPIDLAGRIGECRRTRQEASPLPHESPELIALTAYVAHQSRGMPISPPQDERLAPFRDNGRRLYERRIGQLDLSCASCHDARSGERLGGSVMPQGHPTAYPLYRLEWQAVGSLQRRLRNCMIGVRAEAFAFGAPEIVELELYLMERAAGLPLETPGVRP